MLEVLVRYHRAGTPKRNNADIAALPEEVRPLVRPLVSLLRVADGLDRSRVRDIAANVAHAAIMRQVALHDVGDDDFLAVRMEFLGKVTADEAVAAGVARHRNVFASRGVMTTEKDVGRGGFGYDTGHVIYASNRTVANMIYRRHFKGE